MALIAVHNPLAKDNIEQPHLHLMFSERAVTEHTRGIEEERFFKRNGAKKDPAWNDRNKPDEVREKWVAMMNLAMERAGQEQRLDARSYEERGRHDLAELREPKLLGGEREEAQKLRDEIDALRLQREELPAPHLDQAAAVQQIERESAKAIAEVEQRRDHELSILDKLIEKAREIAVEVKERTVAAAKTVGAFFGVGKEEEAAKAAPVRENVREQEQASPPGPSLSSSIEAQLDQRVGELNRRLTAQESIEAKLANLDRRMDVAEVAKEKQEEEVKPQQEIERSLGRSRGQDFGIER